MPGIQILNAQSDGSGGVMIHWYDPANLDGQPLEGFFHVTAESISELVAHQRRPNRAPEDKLLTVLQRLEANNASPNAINAVAQAWASAYDEVLTDIIDRHNLGLKAVTKDGHEDLEAVRGGAPVRPWNAREPEGKRAFNEFVANK